MLTNVSGPGPPQGRARAGTEVLLDDQLQPLVLPHPSHTWQEPAGRILVPQVMHSGESTAEPVMTSRSSALVWACVGAGFEAAASWLSLETLGVSATFAVSTGSTGAPFASTGVSISSAAVLPFEIGW